MGRTESGSASGQEASVRSAARRSRAILHADTVRPYVRRGHTRAVAIMRAEPRRVLASKAERIPPMKSSASSNFMTRSKGGAQSGAEIREDLPELPGRGHR